MRSRPPWPQVARKRTSPSPFQIPNTPGQLCALLRRRRDSGFTGSRTGVFPPKITRIILEERQYFVFIDNPQRSVRKTRFEWLGVTHISPNIVSTMMKKCLISIQDITIFLMFTYPQWPGHPSPAHSLTIYLPLDGVIFTFFKIQFVQAFLDKT